jgi:hypothetical protein
MAAKEEKKEGVSWMAPFSEDKSGVGEQININIIMEEHQKADEKMRNHGVDPKDIIRKHDEIERNCNEDFKKGHIDADEYRRKIHNIISHGTAVPNPSGTDENGHGVFNFIDRAKDSKSVNVAMAARPTAKELVRQAMAAKRPDNRKEVFSPYVEEEEPKHHSQEYVDEHVANLSPGEKLLGIGMIVQNHTIERMKK